MKTLITAVVCVMALLLGMSNAIATETELTEEQQARVDEQQALHDAIEDASEVGAWRWRIGGFCFGLPVVGVAHLYNPPTPAMNLIGKSPAYVETYDRAYQEKASARITNSATQGCLLLGVVAFFLISVNNP